MQQVRIPPCQGLAVNLQSKAGLCVHVRDVQRRMTKRETSQLACLWIRDMSRECNISPGEGSSRE